MKLEPHVPRRDSDVAAFIKRHRDRYDKNSAASGKSMDFVRYRALDDLLDDYRLHADTGTPLDEEAFDGGDPEAYGVIT